MLRTAPWVAARQRHTRGVVPPNLRRGDPDPDTGATQWYHWKTDLSFADLVRAAQETLRGVDALDFAVAILERDPNVFKGARGEKRTVERRSAGEQELTKAA